MVKYGKELEGWNKMNNNISKNDFREYTMNSIIFLKLKQKHLSYLMKR
jgi:hypothetical protein